MAKRQITRASLGRLAKIGDLYDVRTDTFSGGSALLVDGDQLLGISSTTKINATRAEILFGTDRLSDVLTKLQVEDELRLSVSVGLALPEGSTARFLDDFRDKLSRVGSVRGSVLFTVVTSLEQVNESFLSVPDCGQPNLSMTCDDVDYIEVECDSESSQEVTNDMEILTENEEIVPQEDIPTCPDATHVVTGISWGANVIISLERQEFLAPDRKVLLTELENAMKLLINFDNSISSAAMPEAEDTKYSVEVHSDISLADIPETFSSAFILLRELLNTDEGATMTPLTYIMLPLSAINRSAESSAQDAQADNVDKIDEQTLALVIHLLDDLSSARKQLECLTDSLHNHEQYLNPDDITEANVFRVELDAAENELRQKLSTYLVMVRNRQEGPTALVNLAEEYKQSRYSADSIRRFLTKYDSALEKIAFIDAIWKEGVIYLASDTTNFSDILLQCTDVYVLFSSEFGKRNNRQLWTENCMVFFEILKKEKDRYEKMAGQSEMPTMICVDCDFVPSLAPKEGIAVHRYHNGKCVCVDVAEDMAIVASMNIAESSQVKVPCCRRPQKRVPVELRCPGSLSHCDESVRGWSCEKCREQLEFGFDEYFYCSCGKAPCSSFGFRCSGLNHGNDFIEFPMPIMKEHLSKLTPVKELNILFLGETGVGKSTWINGFANYLSFATLEEAESSESVCLIPSKFTMTDENYEEVEITTGMDRNEDQQTGRSATQMPKSYVFRRGKYYVRIIDTPGIGDTRGIDQDKANLQNIMTHLSNLEELNGICILLKPNNARLTVMFSFCIKELLTHLHRDACKNIVFCFTNARGTFYRPGDTLPALRKLLAEDENKEINIKLCKETIYCIDNEAVRFLAALKHGINFSDAERKNYATSWETSVLETNRLIEHISSLETHKVKNTLSLNDARRLIVALSRPLAEITSTIQNNISVVEQRQAEIRDAIKYKDDLTHSLYIPAIDLQTTPLNYPRTVCTSPGCVRHIKVGNVEKIDYVRHCHPSCGITGAPSNTTNCVALQQCYAMGRDFYCRHCRCSWNVHMHITYECTQVQTQVLDTNIEQQIRDKTTGIELLKQHLQHLEERVIDLEKEKKQIAEVSAKFGCFLKRNAIAPYNDALADYLDHLINVEKGKIGAGGEAKTLEGLQKMRAMYEEEKRILDEAIGNPNSSLRLPSPDGIKQLVQSLYQLKISGPMLKNAMLVADATSSAAAQYSEKRVNPHRYRRVDRNSYKLRQTYTTLTSLLQPLMFWRRN